jgi:hypothetical protein
VERPETCLVCIPVALADSTIVAGSTKHPCAECGQKVWVSPASMKLAKEKKAVYLCIPCAQKMMEDDDEAEIATPSKEQIKELRDTLRRDQTERN